MRWERLYPEEEGGGGEETSSWRYGGESEGAGSASMETRQESEGPIEREREAEERMRARAESREQPVRGWRVCVRQTGKKGGRTGSELEQAAPYTVMRIPTLAVDRYLGPLSMYLPAAGTDRPLINISYMPARADPGSLVPAWGGVGAEGGQSQREDERDGLG